MKIPAQLGSWRLLLESFESKSPPAHGMRLQDILGSFYRAGLP